jgi:hypothetical protein
MVVKYIPNDVTSGGSFDFGTHRDVQILYLKGTVSLTSNYSVLYGSPLEATEIFICYSAIVTNTGGTVNIFGEDVPAEYLSKSMTVRAFYNGEGWEILYNPDMSQSSLISTLNMIDEAITTNKIAPGAVTGSKIGLAAVAVNNLTTAANTSSILRQLSFEANESGDMIISLPYAKQITGIIYFIDKRIAGTDDGNIELFINEASIGSTVIAQNLDIGERVADSNTFPLDAAADVDIMFRTSKVTTGGKLTAVITFYKS